MFTEDQIQEIDDLLAAAGHEALSVEEVHGLMCAALCGPRRLGIEACLPAVFLLEEEQIELDDDETMALLLARLTALYAATDQALASGEFLPVVGYVEEEGSEYVDPEPWCRGFLMGIDLDHKGWKLDRPDVLELLTPVICLASPEEFERAVADGAAGDHDELREELLAAIPECVCGLRAYFQTKRKPARRS